MIVFRGRAGVEIGNRFRLVEELGSGSFGVVWQARCLSDGVVVALKIPRDQEKGEIVLRKEADVIKGVRHPHVVEVHGFHLIGELFVIEMEYVDGYDLAKVLDDTRSHGPLSLEQMLQWILQILDGLGAVHAADISHNDIKPQNILVDKATKTVKLTDFGSSRRVEDVWVWTRRQGTEAYMAPEVAIEGRRAKNVSDIYSVGVLLYEMATGRLPFMSQHQIVTGMQMAMPREINQEIPVELEAMILRALERNPQDRFPSCASMNVAVKSCLQSLRSAESVGSIGARPMPSQVGFRAPTSSPLHHLELAKERLAADDHQGALEAVEAAVDRSEGHPQYLRMLGGICMHLGYHRKAAEAYERMLLPNDRGYALDTEQRREVLERLGELYGRLQRYADAVDVYERVVRQADSPVARFRLGIAVGRDGDYKRAIALLESVRAERKNAVIVYSKLGWAHKLDGNDQLAMGFFNRALALDAYDLESLYELGKYYLLNGDKRRAREYFRRLLDADGIGGYTQRVRKLVEPAV